MNKQQLIDKYNTKKANLRPYCPNRNSITEQLKNDIYKEFIDDLKQLDEPQKPVIQQFVADLVDWTNKQNCTPGDVSREFYDAMEIKELNLPSNLELEKLNEYFEKAHNRYDFEKACFVGYEVEKEPLWVVAVHNGEYYFTRFMSNHNPEDRFPWDSIMDKDKGYHFTDKEKADAVALLIGGTVEVAEV